MIRLKWPKQAAKHSLKLLVCLAILLGMLSPLISPFLSNTANAEPSTAFDTINGGQLRITDPSAYNKISCAGALRAGALDTATINTALRFPSGTSFATFYETAKQVGPGKINLFENVTLDPNPQTNRQLGLRYTDYLVANYGTTKTLLSWYDPGSTLPNKCGGAAPSGTPHLTMIPVDGTGDDVTAWMVVQLTYQDSRPAAPSIFKKQSITSDGQSTRGDMRRLVPQDAGGADFQTQNGVVVAGVYTPSAPVTKGTITKAVFADVTTINVTISVACNTGDPGCTNGLVSFKEVYVDPHWDTFNYYFLTTTESPGRQAITYTAQNVDPKADPVGNPTQNHTPFIWINPNEGINFSHPSDWSDAQVISTMNNKISRFGSNGGLFYNYTPAGLPIGANPAGLPDPQMLAAGLTLDTSLAHLWFYMSKENRALVSAFTTGDGNEADFIGLYLYNESSKTYEHPSSDCQALGFIVPVFPEPAPGANTPIDWTVRKKDLKCNDDYGVLQAIAKMDEAKFTEISGIISDIGDNTDVSQVGELVCDLSVNPLTWIMCPIISAAQFGIEQLDNAINSLLSIDVDRYFNQNCPSGDPQDCSGPGFYKAWNSIRVLGTALIVIAALVMVIAQAAGLEFLDAYTIKKILPRMLAAVILMNLSWELCKQAIEFSELLGLGVRNIIYSPFGGAGAIHVGGGTSSALALVGAGVLLTLGIFATLSLVVSAFLACLVAFAVLVFRQVAIIFLVILAPFAIAASILPNTSKAWKFWWESFSKMLLMFPIIVAFIAAGRVFAFVSHRADSDNLFFQLIAIIAYFAPYFLIPATFRLAGGAIATVGGFVNDRSRGVFDRLKNYRANTAKERGQKMREGTLYEGSRFIPGSRTAARAFNRVSLGVGAGARGHFGLPTARGRAAVSQTRFGAADKLMKSDQMHGIIENDDALRAATYRTAADARAAGLSEDAIGAVQTTVGFGAVQQVAAAKAMINTGTAYRDMQDWATTAARVANGNEGTLADVVGYGNAMAKKNRVDLTPGFGESLAAARRVMQGGGLSQGGWDALTMKGIRNSGAPTTVLANSKEAVTKNYAAVSDRLRDAMEGRNRNYGLSTADQERLEEEVVATGMEFEAANYSTGAIGTGEHAYQVIHDRATAVRHDGLRRELLEQGRVRIFGQSGGGGGDPTGIPGVGTPPGG